MVGKGKINCPCSAHLGQTLGCLWFFYPTCFGREKFQLMKNQGERLAMGFQKIQILVEIRWAVGPSPREKRRQPVRSLCWPHPTEF